MAKVRLTGNKREGVGKNKVSKLRNEEKIPGVVYEKGEENINVEVNKRDFELCFREAGHTTIVDLSVEGKPYPVIIKEVQTHPFKNQVLHIDFQKINMKEKIRLEVPVVLSGRDDIRIDGATLMQIIDAVEVECLPADIPEEILADVSKIDFDTPVYLKDLDIMKNDKITVHADPEEIIATLVRQQEEVEEETEEVSAADVPTVSETESKDDEE